MRDHVFLGRQPILDRQQKIVAYELLFRYGSLTAKAEINDQTDVGATVFANMLCVPGAKWALGEKQAFVPVSASMLSGDGIIETLPPNRVVLELSGTEQFPPQMLARCQNLRVKGFRFALAGFVLNEQSAMFLPIAGYVKVDIRQTSPDKVRRLLSALEKRRIATKLLAENVETAHEFKELKALGFTYFQGYYFEHPETLSAKTINPAYENVLLLINKVRENVSPMEIEQFFKHDVALTFKLLRYINSVGFGLSCEIESIRHAITILGYQQLYRWLTLLLATAGQATTPHALLITAMTRGRLTELLGQDYLEQQERDNLFIVGIFSLLDVILETPMELVVEKLSLPASVSDALLTREGIYGPFLGLAEACENCDFDKIEELSAFLQLEPKKVNRVHLEALSWAESLGV